MNKYTLTIVILLTCSFFALGQPGGPSAPAPFGFLEVLAVSGAAYGIARKKKLFERNRE